MLYHTNTLADFTSYKACTEMGFPVCLVMLARQIKATHGQIDRLVYKLYGLTEEEIRIVEGK